MELSEGWKCQAFPGLCAKAHVESLIFHTDTAISALPSPAFAIASCSICHCHTALYVKTTSRVSFFPSSV